MGGGHVFFVMVQMKFHALIVMAHMKFHALIVMAQLKFHALIVMAQIEDHAFVSGEGGRHLAVPPSRGTATLDGALLVRLSTPRLVRSKRNRITRRSHLISTLTGCDSRNRGSITDPFCSLAVPFLKLSI